MKVIVQYRDDGPQGIAPQITSVTSPWNRLYVYEGESAQQDARAFAAHLEAHRGTWPRRNARICGWWEDYDDTYDTGTGGVGPGPIVPLDQRPS